MYIVCKINICSNDLEADFILGNSFLEAVNFTKILILISILILDMILGLMNVQLFHCQVVIDLVKIQQCFSAHPHNRKKDVLLLGKGQPERLDDDTVTVEFECSIKFTEKK